MVITYPKKGETTIDIRKEKVTIKYGDCPTPGTQAADNGTAKIDTPTDAGPTLKITDIKPAGTATLENTKGTPECTVKVDAEKGTLTINYKQSGTDKCIEITLNTNDIKKEATTVSYGHIFTEGFDTILSH